MVLERTEASGDRSLGHFMTLIGGLVVASLDRPTFTPFNPKRKRNMNAVPEIMQPLEWHGGKYCLASKIIDLMPKHLHYVEPHGGRLAILLNKDPFDPRHQWGTKNHEQGISEVVNDIYGPLQNFWDVLKDEAAFVALQRILDAMPFSEVDFEWAADRLYPLTDPDPEAAAAFFVRCRQSRAGNFKGFATLSRTRTRRNRNEQSSAWLNAIEGLKNVHARLRGVVILCRDALGVIRQQDGAETLHYLDPPYLPSTRTSIDAYEHEMSEEDHRQMLETIVECKGSVMLSGYHNKLYDSFLSQWNRHDFKIDNKVSGAKSKRKVTESVWCNF